MLTAKEWNIDFGFDDEEEQEERIGENKYFQEFSTEEEYQRNKNYMKTPHVALITDTEQLHYCDQHDYVEIAGVKWATMNIGAANETDVGLYFQWGDTQGYTADQVGEIKQFTWEDYKYATDAQSMVKMTKYNNTDGKTVLDPEDDAVTAAWGSKWRLPSREEIEDLRDSTDAEFVEINGVNCLKLTDLSDDSKVLIFPCSGYCTYGEISHAEDRGEFHLNGIVSSNKQYAYDVKFTYDDTITWESSGWRYIGRTARGVMNE